MDEKMHPTEYQPTYQTGTARPPKGNGGALAVVLSAVIFICSISTILSLMRINFLQRLSSQAEQRQCTMSFEAHPVNRSASGLGFQGQTLPVFWQRYHALPEGVFITQAEAGQVLLPGDVLLELDSQPITDWDRLQELLHSYNPGEAVRITVYRDGARKPLRLIIGN